jgi:hypothetical protein
MENRSLDFNRLDQWKAADSRGFAQDQQEALHLAAQDLMRRFEDGVRLDAPGAGDRDSSKRLIKMVRQYTEEKLPVEMISGMRLSSAWLSADKY